MTFEQTTLPHLHFTKLHKVFIDEHIEHARIGKVDQGGEEGGTGHRFFAASRQNCQGIAQNSAAYAKTQRVDLLGTCDVLNLTDGLDGCIFNVVIPRLLGHAFIGVAPADHKCSVALTHGISDEGVVGLQIKNVKLVDARGYQQKWFFVNLGRQRLVLDQLKKFILKDHSTFCGGHIFTHHKLALVCHRHMALLHIMQQVLYAFGQTFTFGFDGFLLSFCIECQEVAGCRSCNPLLHCKLDFVLRVFVGLNGFCQTHHGFGIEQISAGCECCHWIACPSVRGKAAIFDVVFGLNAMIPKRGGFFQIRGL